MRVPSAFKHPPSASSHSSTESAISLALQRRLTCRSTHGSRRPLRTKPLIQMDSFSQGVTVPRPPQPENTRRCRAVSPLVGRNRQSKSIAHISRPFTRTPLGPWLSVQPHSGPLIRRDVLSLSWMGRTISSRVLPSSKYKGRREPSEGPSPPLPPPSPPHGGSSGRNELKTA